MQVRNFPGVRNNPKYKACRVKFSDSETNAVDRYGALKYDVLLKAGGKLDFDPVIGPLLFHGEDGGCRVDMTLNQVPVESPVCRHGSLQVHEVAWANIAQIGAV
jgi:hypothetical protein